MRKLVVILLCLVALVVGADRRGLLMEQQPSSARNPSVSQAYLYYAMDTTNTGFDSVGHANMTLDAGVTNNPNGVVNGCGYFPSGDVIARGVSFPTNGSGITIRLWLKITNSTANFDPPSTFSSWEAFLGQSSFSPITFVFQQKINTGTTPNTITPFIGFRVPGDRIVSSGVNVPLGSWIHLVSVYDRAVGNCLFFVNGVQTVNTNLAGLGSLTGTSTSILFGDFTGTWIGFMDEVGVWTFPWSSNDVLLDYNNGAGQGFP